MKNQFLMMVIILSVLISQNCCKESGGEVPDEETPWSRLYGGSSNEFACDIKPTIDGGYAVFGQTMSVDKDVTVNHGDWDFWLVKLDKDGMLDWQKTYGGSYFDRANAFTHKKDGGYVLTGMTESNDGDVSGNHGSGDVFVVSLSPAGDVEWVLVWGGSGSDEGLDVIESINGEILIVGMTGSSDGDLAEDPALLNDGFILCLNPTGSIKWHKNYGAEGMDVLSSIIQATDGSLVTAGYSDSEEGDFTGNNGSYDAWLMMLNPTGNPIWNKMFGGTECEAISSLVQTSDGNFAAIGSFNESDGDMMTYDFLISRFDLSGNLLWSKQLGGSDFDYGLNIIESNDKCILVIGRARSSDGDVLKNHGNEDVLIVKLNNSGEILWKKPYGGTMDDIGSAILQNSKGSIIVAGVTESNNGDVTGNKGGFDFWIFKILQP